MDIEKMETAELQNLFSKIEKELMARDKAYNEWLEETSYRLSKEDEKIYKKLDAKSWDNAADLGWYL